MIAYAPPIFNVAEADDVAPVLVDGGYLQWDEFSGQFRTVAVDLSGYAPLDSPVFRGGVTAQAFTAAYGQANGGNGFIFGDASGMYSPNNGAPTYLADQGSAVAQLGFGAFTVPALGIGPMGFNPDTFITRVSAGVVGVPALAVGGTPHPNIPSLVKIISSDAVDAYFGAAVGGAVGWIESYGGEAGVDSYDYAHGHGIPFSIGGVATGGNATFLKFFASGAERMRLDAAGNVGIGTTTPYAKLDIASGDIALTNGQFVGGRFSSQSFIRPMLGFSADTVDTILRSAGANPVTSGISFQGYDGNEVMRVMNSGNVGIGTTTPGEKLEVAGGIYVSGQSTITNRLNVAEVQHGSGVAFLLSSDGLAMGANSVVGWTSASNDQIPIDTSLTRHASNIIGTPGDLRFSDASRGPIVQDRTTGNFFRLYVDSGVMGLELAT